LSTAARLRRLLCAFVAVLAVIGGLPAGLAAQETGDGASDGAVVRIVARLLDDGRTEFGLQQRAGVGSDGSSVWGERRLPRARFFPRDVPVGDWLVSSPLEVGSTDGRTASTEVRITARRLADRRVEFGLQQRAGVGAGEWGGRLLPQRRFFPATARVGAWLSSSALGLGGGDGVAPALEPRTPPPTEPPQDSGGGGASTGNGEETGGSGGNGGGESDVDAAYAEFLAGVVEAVQWFLEREDVIDESGFDPDALIVAAEVTMSILVNELRSDEGLEELVYQRDLAHVARNWSETMASESPVQASGGDAGHFRHNPNITEEYPPGWWSAGENIALVPIGRDDDPWEAIQESVRRAFQSLVQSPGHYANMVNPLFDTIGVGIAIRDGDVYVTQNFAAMIEPPPITVEP
jgi:hypothetical protein